MTTHEPPMAPEVAQAKGLRTGWTTGTCASAAAKAATLWLVDGHPPERVQVALAGRQRVAFPVADVDLAVPHRCGSWLQGVRLARLSLPRTAGDPTEKGGCL